MVSQGTRRRESSCSNLKTPNPRVRGTTAAGGLPESSTTSEAVASETENIGYALLESLRPETGDTSLDNARITMRTRVAVRDKTPHRFQVVPLRDVGRISDHSFNSAENRPTSFATPVTPKKGSNRNFSMASSFGWKHKTDLTPSETTPPKRISSSRNDTNLCGTTMAANHTSTLSHGTQRMGPVGSCTFGSSVSTSDRSMVLSGWDVNWAQNRKLTHELDAISHTPSPLSIDSIHELIRSESPLTQTISRSLRYRGTSVNVIKQSKSTSLNNVASFNSQQAEIPLGVNTANLQRSSHDQSLFHDSNDQSYYSLLDAYDTSESMPTVLSSKRHAIYTPSVYVPDFGQRVMSGDKVGHPLDTNLFSQGSSDNLESMHESAGDPSSEDDADTTIRPKEDRMNQGCLATVMSSSMPDDLPGLKHKSSSRSLPLCVPRGLNHSKPLQPIKYIGTVDGSRPGAMVYPRIVLSLFAELDSAIDEWSR